jgi:hypothetical protein
MALKIVTVFTLAAAFFSPTTGTAQDFHGYSCSQDCSGHEAGYRWAALHDISDPEDCGGNSQSFIEGCEAYAEEHSDQDDDACDEDDPDDCDGA